MGISFVSLAMAPMLLLFALLLVLAFPQRIHKVASEATKHLGKTMLVGLLVGSLLPLLAVMAAVTLIGLPVGLFLLLIWLLLIMLSGPVAGYYLGSMLLSKSKNPIAIMLLGAALLILLYILPMVGGLFLFIGYWIGAGAWLLHFKHHTPKPVYKVK